MIHALANLMSSTILNRCAQSLYHNGPITYRYANDAKQSSFLSNKPIYFSFHFKTHYEHFQTILIISMSTIMIKTIMMLGRGGWPHILRWLITKNDKKPIDVQCRSVYNSLNYMNYLFCLTDFVCTIYINSVMIWIFIYRLYSNQNGLAIWQTT